MSTINYWENVEEIHRKQTEKGINTYGMRLEDNQDPSILERITYIEEELIDGLMYLEWVKDWLCNMT